MLGTVCRSSIPPAVTRAATLMSVEKDVQARPSAKRDFPPARVELQLAADDEIKASEASCTRREIQPGKTTAHFDSNMTFAPAEFPAASGNLSPACARRPVRIWIILCSGRLAVKTLAGVTVVHSEAVVEA